MAFLLPVVAGWIAFFLMARQMAARGWLSQDRRVAFVLAGVGWGGTVAGITELCGLLHRLTCSTVVTLWLGVDVLLCAVAVRLVRSGPEAGEWFDWRRALPDKTDRATWVGGWRESPVSLGLSAGLAVFLGLIAWLTPTTNWDSLTYHLPRVLHWIQQQSLAHYPTSLESQLQMGPWAAYVQVQLFLIGGTDQWVNLPQWSAMVGCMIVSTLITRQLLAPTGSAPFRIQVFAALLVVTLPTGLVESITPQTDYVTAFWLLCWVSLVLELRQQVGNPWYWLGAGLALGLGLLTKVSMVFYAGPFLAALVVVAFRSSPPLVAAGRLGGLLAVAAMLSAPHALRNERLYGSPVGSSLYQDSTRNTRISLSTAASNLIRNLALHTGTGIRPLTVGLNRTLKGLHSLTGRDWNDPDASFRLGRFEFYDRLVIFDSYAGSPYHLALIGCALALCLAKPRDHSLLLVYAALILVSLLLMCVLLRWQRWNGRLHLPCLVALMPFVAAGLKPCLRGWCGTLLSVGLTVFAGVVIANNVSRPVFNPAFREMPRVQQMLAIHAPQLHTDMVQVVQEVIRRGGRNVGLNFGIDDPEYPFWLLFLGYGLSGRIDHVGVDNPSGRIPLPVEPDVIISVFEGPLSGPLSNRYHASTVVGTYTLHWSRTVASPGLEPKPESRE